MINFTLFALGDTLKGGVGWVHAGDQRVVVNFARQIFQSSIGLSFVGYKVSNFNYN